MSRNIVYPAPPGGPVRGSGDSVPPDDYAGKLVKYVPAEVLAFFLAVTPLTNDLVSRWVVLGLGLVLTVIVIISGKEFRSWTLVLGGISFLVWAGLTTDYYTVLFAAPVLITRIVMLFLVFAVPFIDQIITSRERADTP